MPSHVKRSLSQSRVVQSTVDSEVAEVAEVAEVVNGESYSHFILYAKGWYTHNNTMLDLQKLVSNYCLLDETCVTPNDIWNVLCLILFKVGKPHEIERIMSELFTPEYHEMKENKFADFVDIVEICPMERAINKILRVFNLLSVTDGHGKRLMNLSRPDENLLPIYGPMDKWDKWTKSEKVS